LAVTVEQVLRNRYEDFDAVLLDHTVADAFKWLAS